MSKNKGFEIEKSTFLPSAIILGVVLLIGIVFPTFFHSSVSFLFDFTTIGFGWFYLIVSLALLFICFYVAASPFGKKIIGGPDAKPEHNVFSWCAMAVCSGIATAMVFYAVGEPLSYFYNPPAFTYLDPLTPQAAVRAIQISSFHWSFLYYGIFAFWGLAVGYMSMNHNLPYRPSSALYPLIKEKIFGWQGKVVDVLSILALVGGIVTSLGFGTTQFASGMQFVFGIEPSNMIYALTILVVTLSYTISSSRGLNKGMKIISNANAYIYIIITAFLVIFGPTVFLANLFTESVASMLDNFISTALNADAFNVGEGWSRNNTVFFMAWIMAYAPLVGMFLAKISRGRSVRAYLMVNIFVPGIFVFIWFTAFGGNAIYQDFFNNAGIYETIQNLGFPVANFALLQNMPLYSVMIPLLVAVLFFSFITLADAMTGTISAVTLKHSSADEAPRPIKLFWGIMIGATTLICLFALGEVGTTALQTMSIVYALPIFIFTLPVIVSVFRMVSGKVDSEMALIKLEVVEDEAA